MQLEQVKGLYYPLVWLVAEAAEDATTVLSRVASHHHTTVISVGKQLAEALIPMTTPQRRRQAGTLLQDLAQPQGGGIVFLDRLEVLFEPTLSMNAGKQIESLSRSCTAIVATWPGRHVGASLVFGNPGHPSYQTHPLGACPILILDADLHGSIP
jgi:hypothetical protein